MSFSFPTFRLSGPVILLDDEVIAHRLLKHLFPKSWIVKSFTDQLHFTAEMTRQIFLQERISQDLSSVISSFRTQGTDLIDSVRDFWKRQAELPADLVLIDLMMPSPDGVELLTRDPLRSWEGRKVLLTAYVDDWVAIDAFNRHLIDQFVSKASLTKNRNQALQLITAIKSQGNSLLERTWSTQISLEQMQNLESAHERLAEFIGREGFDDYFVIGQPFGILGRGANGQRWLQLETDESLESLIEILENTGADPQDREDVRERKSIMAVELGTLRLRNNKQPATLLSTKGIRLWGAIFDIEDDDGGSSVNLF